MSELCACPATNCPLKDKCARNFEPELGDTIFLSTPYNRATGQCASYVNWNSVIERKKEKANGKTSAL